MNNSPAGILPALLVPVRNDGKTDTDMLARQADYLVDAGAHGIFVNGSTAESPFMSIPEKIEVIEVVQETVAQRIPLYVACIQPSTEQVLEEMRHVERLKPDFLVATTPFYFGVSQQVILQHYRTLAAAVSVPLLAYDIPSCTHNKIEFDTMLEISTIENLVGMKDSSGDLVKFGRAIRASASSEGSSRNFAWIQGDDYLDAPSLLSGAAGIVTGTGNVSLEPYMQLWEAAKHGNISGVLEQQQRINHLCQVFERAEKNVIPGIKSATAFLGRSNHYTRMKGCEVPEKYHNAIRDVLIEAGLMS